MMLLQNDLALSGIVSKFRKRIISIGINKPLYWRGPNLNIDIHIINI